MGYLNEDGLARYDGLIKQWVTLKSGTVDGVDPLLNWQQTDTAGAVTFSPLPAAPIDPVVNFQFSETGPASGDKAPDNPSTITGVSSVKVTKCGKNIIPNPYRIGAWTNNGVTFTPNTDGTVHVKGEATATTFYGVTTSNDYIMTSGVQYTLSGTPAGGGSSTYSMRIGDYTATSDNGSGNTFTAGNGYENARVVMRVASGADVDVVFRPQLELGSAATAFEPYAGADYTVNLGGTYYGGSVDLSTGTMTVNSQKVLLDASCGFGYYSGANTDSLAAAVVQINSLPVANGVFVTGRCACNKFPIHAKIDGEESIGFTSPTYSFSSKQIRVYLKWTTLGVSSSASSQEIIAAIKAWFTENPVELIVTYEDYSSTITLTPIQIYSLSQTDPYTPRLNTVYSDQTSVEVGYPKSPQATSSELTNAIISLGGEI